MSERNESLIISETPIMLIKIIQIINSTFKKINDFCFIQSYKVMIWKD